MIVLTSAPPPPVRAARVQDDFRGGDHVVAVLLQEGQVGLDVGGEYARGGGLGPDPGAMYASPRATSPATTSRTSSSLPSKWHMITPLLVPAVS
jgi:hypothetical protein